MRLVFAAALLAGATVAATAIPGQMNEAPAVDLSKRQCGCDCVSPKFIRPSSLLMFFPLCCAILSFTVIHRTTRSAEEIVLVAATLWLAPTASLAVVLVDGGLKLVGAMFLCPFRRRRVCLLLLVEWSGFQECRG
ncbi:hypothetical protein F5144DRAFT_299842 [Chaetomium tenue]|uniref:Uncharacterized protein n=1 Tax=Chaetomium tenue TaxID=1854479 RepID=A0ACB7P2S4_9PEZI|nr:hypothetical protein F5144DRAFT_299842 [Chaetomium globosum]